MTQSTNSWYHARNLALLKIECVQLLSCWRNTNSILLHYENWRLTSKFLRRKKKSWNEPKTLVKGKFPAIAADESRLLNNINRKLYPITTSYYMNHEIRNFNLALHSFKLSWTENHELLQYSTIKLDRRSIGKHAKHCSYQLSLPYIYSFNVHLIL